MNRNPGTMQGLESGFVENLAAIKMVVLTHQDVANAKKVFNQKVFKQNQKDETNTTCLLIKCTFSKKRNKIIN